MDDLQIPGEKRGRRQQIISLINSDTNNKTTDFMRNEDSNISSRGEDQLFTPAMIRGHGESS